MNFLAHGYRHIDRPYFVAGTALPDWLRICGRRLRPPLDPGPLDGWESELFLGLERHHADDHRFHTSKEFCELADWVSRTIRNRFASDTRLRSYFLGHVLTEMLLDAVISSADSDLLDDYYASIAGIDATRVEATANRWLVEPTKDLRARIEQFRRDQFLRDYHDDELLIARLGQVARRVRLPALPDGFVDLVPSMRERVGESASRLL